MENTMARRRYSEKKRSFFNLGLRYESPAKAVRYFCTPKKAEIFASLGVGGIHFCTIPSFGELVFAVVPEALTDGMFFRLPTIWRNSSALLPLFPARD